MSRPVTTIRAAAVALGAAVLAVLAPTAPADAQDGGLAGLSVELGAPGPLLPGQPLPLRMTVRNASGAPLDGVPLRLRGSLALVIHEAEGSRILPLSAADAVGGFAEPSPGRTLKPGQSFLYSTFVHMRPGPDRVFLLDGPGVVRVSVRLIDAGGRKAAESAVVEVQVGAPQGVDAEVLEVLRKLSRRDRLASWPSLAYLDAEGMARLRSEVAADVQALASVQGVASAYAPLIRFYIANVDHFSSVVEEEVFDGVRRVPTWRVVDAGRLVAAQAAYEALGQEGEVVLAPQSLAMLASMTRLPDPKIQRAAQRALQGLVRRFPYADVTLTHWPDEVADKSR
jgi:hypothetical protein